MRACHVYKDVWKPSIGERCVAKREFNNPMDKHTISLVSSPKWHGFFLACKGEISDRLTNMFYLDLLKVTIICDPTPASLLPLKEMVSYINCAHDFEPNILAKRCRLFMSFYGNLTQSLVNLHGQPKINGFF